MKICDKEMERSKWFIKLPSKNVRFKSPMLRLDLCDYSDAYIAMKWGNSADNRENKKLSFKNNAPFTSCISNINNTFIDNTEDLDVVMPMYNLLEYSNDYSMISGIL